VLQKLGLTGTGVSAAILSLGMFLFWFMYKSYFELKDSLEISIYCLLS
jgi:hypothetical protein